MWNIKFGERTKSISNSSALVNQGAILNASVNKLENEGEEMNLACFLAFGSIKWLK